MFAYKQPFTHVQGLEISRTEALTINEDRGKGTPEPRK